MSLHPDARHGAEALSHQAKAGVVPIEKPARRERRRTGLSRGSELVRSTALKPGASKLKRTPLGHASAAQKAKVEREGPRLDKTVTAIARLELQDLGPTDPAHITPRPQGGCDHEDCICPLPRRLHDLYDEGKLDLLPYLTREEQAHAVQHLGILGALKRTTGENYVPDQARLRVIDGGAS